MPGAEAVASERFLVKGVTYGTFAPDAQGYQFPSMQQVAADFRQMASLGINTVRTYTPPRRDLLDAAAGEGLRVMVGLPWSQHVAFLDDRALKRGIRRDLTARIAEPARLRPVAPTIRRPQRFPHRRMIASENHPPVKQATTPNANGRDVSHPAVTESR